MDKLTNRGKAYSYLRFSTPDQLKGDSLRRQTEAARRYADAHGLDLDESLTFRDLGVSAFRGKNAVEGALAAFIEAVDTGRVKPGSYLLIESLDRLSRDRIMPALNRFSDLLGKGVRIVTLSDGQVYDSDSINSLTGLIVPLVTMARANEESEMKSKRLRAAWKQKKAEAAKGEHVITSRAPAWLRLRDGKFELIENRTAIVRRIFTMTLAGHGKATIARRFNEEGIEPFGDGPSNSRKANGWHASYVQKILRNPAVIGRYEPMRNTYVDGRRKRVPDGEPIEGYYPAVVEEPIFYSVKHAAPRPSGKGKSPLRNVLSGLVYCARCGGRMHWVNKGPRPKGGQYLACDNARRKRTCDAKSVTYEPVLAYVLDRVKDFRDIEPDDSAAQERDRELDAIGGQIEESEEAIGRLLDTLERVQSEAAEKRLAALESKLASLKARREEIREKVIAREDRRSFDCVVFDTFLDTSPRLPTSKTSADDLTAHIASELRRMVERVEVEKGEPIKITPRSDD